MCFQLPILLYSLISGALLWKQAAVQQPSPRPGKCNWCCACAAPEVESSGRVHMGCGNQGPERRQTEELQESLLLQSPVSGGWAFPAGDNTLDVSTSFVSLEGETWCLGCSKAIIAPQLPTAQLPSPVGSHVGKGPPSSCTPREAHTELARWG